AGLRAGPGDRDARDAAAGARREPAGLPRPAPRGARPGAGRRPRLPGARRREVAGAARAGPPGAAENAPHRGGRYRRRGGAAGDRAGRPGAPVIRALWERWWSRRPTREGWRYIMVALGLGLAGLNTGNNLVYLLCSLLLAVILVSGTLTRQSMRG